MSNIFNTFQQGSNLGMFNFGQPQPNQFGNIEELIGKLPADKQAAAREKYINDLSEAQAMMRAVSPFMPERPKLSDLESFREREARRAQELGKESLREAFKYSMLASIPKTIAQSFANISAMNLQGAQNATDTFSKTLASYPRAQFNTPNIQYEKYFS